MNSSTALTVVPRPVTASAPTRKSRPWRTAFLVITVLGVLALLSLYQHLGPALGQLSGLPLSVVIDGEEVFSNLSLPVISPMEQLLAAGAILLTALLLAVLVPTMLLLVLLVVAAVLLFALGVPLVFAAAGMLLLLSPLILMLLLAWWILKAIFG